MLAELLTMCRKPIPLLSTFFGLDFDDMNMPSTIVKKI